MKKHILICNWNDHSRGLVDQLLADEGSRTRQIVIVADLPEHPYIQSGVDFVAGSPTRDDVLEKACVDTADTAIITGNDGDVLHNDSIAILTALAIEAKNPGVYTCVLIFDAANQAHLKHAHVDEVVCVGDMTSGILAQAALNHGLTSLMRQLISFGEGCEIYKVRVPAEAHGKDFVEVADLMLRKYSAMLLAVETDGDGRRHVMTCPSAVQEMQADDCAFVYAESFPVGLEAAVDR